MVVAPFTPEGRRSRTLNPAQRQGIAMRRFVGQRGETLVEVLIAIVLIGAISSSYFLTASTQTRASSLNKELVQADTVARSYAELAKAAVLNGCAAGQPLTVDMSTFPAGTTMNQMPPTPNVFNLTTPTSGPGAPICPGNAAPQEIDLTISTPSKATAHLNFAVLAP